MRSRPRERAMVRGMLAGDEAAFEEFSDGYIPQLYRFAWRRVGADRELAREVVQATVCKAIAKLASFRGEAALMTWLIACCRNEIAAHFRSKLRSGQEIDIEAVEATSGAELAEEGLDSPEQAALRGEAARLVHDALDELPPRYGRALEWKYLEGLSVKEIAGRLQVGPKAAESLLTRARQAFRDRYDRLATEAPPAAAEPYFSRRRLGFES